MIVIPMAGLSSRFFKAGYKEPKYMLMAHNKTLFDHAVGSFSQYFKTESFLFIVRDVYQTPKFVAEQAKSMGIDNFHIVSLDQETRGQAETVTLGIEKWQEETDNQKDCPVTIFNIDTFRPGFTFPQLNKLGDGYLEVFRGSGDNWSFAKPISDDSTQVSKTTEKNPISDLCCTGLYHFRSLAQYLTAYYTYLDKPIDTWEKGELYVAPLYNNLIEQGLEIHYNLIPRDEVIFCGVPQEYTDFLQTK
ncbi:glycosyltransferase family 2 protein [Vibrio methylphosphonaticus]|uniref:glycosyltransferase family 2 protein n=1 Tax=Vibrio methylphosphonaticus TaxID=2946866 RepID=UPI002029D02E|nr:glycosyltransferase family 2 protein [Vibrio methylphosphonaticus]MCL9775436.1 glycosyltransferase family 2 protein [Vibrio methylphosphonaticus]